MSLHPEWWVKTDAGLYCRGCDHEVNCGHEPDCPSPDAKGER